MSEFMKEMFTENKYDLDGVALKYFNFVESEMKKIDSKLQVSWVPKISGIRVQLRGRKPMGPEIAKGLNDFFSKYNVVKYGDWFSYGQPIKDKESRIEIHTRMGDAITKHLGIK